MIMKITEELLKHFPFLKTKTAKYLLIFSILRRIAVVIFLVIYNWENLF
jgi:hypothetical protein